MADATDHSLHLDPEMPDVAELSDRGRRSSWELPGAVQVVDDVEKWKAIAEKVAIGNGFLVIEWAPEPAGGFRALMRPRPDPAEVLDAVKAALARFDLTIGEAWETPEGTMRVEFVPD